jgi:hypothetical protein
MPKKITIEEFIKRSNLRHNNKYNYDQSLYLNSKEKIEIICPYHGVFYQLAGEHLRGCGCPDCDPTKVLGIKKFISKAKQIHGDKYDYSLVDYISNREYIIIICPKHGEFKQVPEAHLRKQGCPKCSTNQKRTTEEYIKLCNDVHGEIYDYSLVEYVNKKTNVKIICKQHGVFEQRADLHLKGHGCKICKKSKMELYLIKKLKELNINFITDKKYSNCKNKYPLSFDFHLIDYNILIECDGIQHQKPIEFFGGNERYEYQKINDAIKTKYCIDNEILLMRVNDIKDIDILSVSLKNITTSLT